jgi:hypothetical protein
VRAEVWSAYRAFSEKAVALTKHSFERGQREGSVARDADCEGSGTAPTPLRRGVAPPCAPALPCPSTATRDTGPGS